MSYKIEFKKDFELIDFIGKGVSSEVYRGLRVDPESDFSQVVAIKVFKSHKFRKKFQNELKNLSKVNHPNVVSVKDWGEQDQKFYLVTEYIHGKDLSEVWKSEEFNDLKLKKYILNQIYSGIKELKNKGIAHGDLKPSNIMLSITGEVKLVDISFDDLGQVFATPEFTAPEVLSGSRASFEADLYSLGVISNNIGVVSRKLVALEPGDRRFDYYKGVDDSLEKTKLSQLVRTSISDFKEPVVNQVSGAELTQELQAPVVSYKTKTSILYRYTNIAALALICMILSFSMIPKNPKVKTLKLRSLNAYEFWDGQSWNSLPYDFVYFDPSNISYKKLKFRNSEGEYTMVINSNDDLSKSIVIDAL